jgi:hypothetical protein
VVRYLSAEDKGGNLRFLGVSKPEGFGKPSPELRNRPHNELGAQIAEEQERQKTRSKRRSSRTKRRGARIIALDRQASEFAETLKREFCRWVKRSPRAFKKRVVSLIASHSPPYPGPGGRHRFPHITQAAKRYRDQLREVREKAKAKVAWISIARECIPGFGKMPYYARTHRLDRLRNAVYARLKREREGRRQRRSARPPGPLSDS